MDANAEYLMSGNRYRPSERRSEAAIEEHQIQKVLLEAWKYWNPFALTGTDMDRYESLAIMTLYELKCRPTVDELTDSIHYFLELENPTARHTPLEAICLFAGLLSACITSNGLMQ